MWDCFFKIHSKLQPLCPCPTLNNSNSFFGIISFSHQKQKHEQRWDDDFMEKNQMFNKQQTLSYS